MNKNIQALIRIATKTTSKRVWDEECHDYFSVDGYELDAGKFAELIVRECASIVEDFGTDVENGDIFKSAQYKDLSDLIGTGHIGAIAWTGSEKLKEHFGVK